MKASAQILEYEGISTLITACIPNLLEKRRRQPVSISKCMAVYYHDVIKKMAFFHHLAQMARNQGRATDAQVTVSPTSGSATEKALRCPPFVACTISILTRDLQPQVEKDLKDVARNINANAV